jgi:hypothetical protein
MKGYLVRSQAVAFGARLWRFLFLLDFLLVKLDNTVFRLAG